MRLHPLWQFTIVCPVVTDQDGGSADPAREALLAAIRRRKDARALTTVALAEAAGVARGTVADLLSEKRWPRQDSLLKILAALDLPASSPEDGKAAFTRMGDQEKSDRHGDSLVVHFPGGALAHLTATQLDELDAALRAEGHRRIREILANRPPPG